MLWRKNQAYHILGTINGGNRACTHAFYNNILTFLNWIKNETTFKERAECGTNDWSSRSHDRWHTWLGKDGCNLGKDKSLIKRCFEQDINISKSAYLRSYSQE